jgi:hypothetical protein
MKYLQALAEKNLNLEDLSKKIKEKIQAIEEAQKKWQEKIEPTDEEKEDYDNFLNELDIETESLINKFNLEAHKKKIERMSELGKKNAKAKKEEQVNPLEEEVVESQLFEKLKELKESVEIDTERFKEQIEEEKPEPELVEAEEIEDFKRTKTIRPKSQSMGIIIAVAGGFLLCWGLLMYAHSKRQNG